MDPKLSVIGLLALFWTTNGACAQAAQSWTGPYGDFTVTIPDGWAAVADGEAGERRLLTIGSAAMRQNPADLFRECIVEQLPMPDVRASTQAELNARGAAATQQDIFRDRQLASFEHEVRGGVLVTTAIALEQGLWSMHSLFVLATRNGPVQYSLACGATGGAELDADMKAMTRFVQSVTFNL